MVEPIKLSVVIPNYNHAEFLGRSLDSVFGNSLPPDEVIVVDDGSTDNSWEVLEAYAKAEPRLRLFRNQRNRGVVYTMNRGLGLAKGEYLHFGSADDVVSSALYEKSISMLAKYPQAGVCSAIVRYVSDKDLTVMLDPPPGALGEEPRFLNQQQVADRLYSDRLWYAGPTAVWKRRAVADCGGLRPELRAFTDGFLFQVVACTYGACFIPEILGDFRVAEGGVSMSEQKNVDAYEARMSAVIELMTTIHKDLFQRRYVKRVRKTARFIHMKWKLATLHAQFKNRTQSIIVHIMGGLGFKLAKRLLAARFLATSLRFKRKERAWEKEISKWRDPEFTPAELLSKKISARRDRSRRLLEEESRYRAYCDSISNSLDTFADKRWLPDRLFLRCFRMLLSLSVVGVGLVTKGSCFHCESRIKELTRQYEAIVGDNNVIELGVNASTCESRAA